MQRLLVQAFCLRDIIAGLAGPESVGIPPGETGRICVCGVPLTLTADGDFSDETWQIASPQAHTNRLTAQALRDGRVEMSTAPVLRPGMLVAQAVGRSKEPLISHGASCLFQRPVTGTRQGRILLVQHRDIHDPETGGSYTVKRYRSEKIAGPDGTRRHVVIHLEPANPEFAPIVLNDTSEEDMRAVAEFVEVLRF